MKMLSIGKDGGPESTVWGYWLFEFKPLASIVLLCFENGSREAYHSHAFNAVSWLLRGKLVEYILNARGDAVTYEPRARPIYTPRSRFHRVVSEGRSWVLSIRGPWAKNWYEYLPGGKYVKLADGRREV